MMAQRKSQTTEEVVVVPPQSSSSFADQTTTTATVSSQPVSALNLLLEERRDRRNRPCFLQHPELALPLGITQLYGAAGTGKTQLALSMCADSVFRNQQAIYIGLGGSNSFGMASRRLETMIKARLAKNNNNKLGTTTTTRARNNREDDDTAVHSLLSNIFLQWVPNGEDLLDLIGGGLHRFLHHHPDVSLVVLDGIANLFRQPDGNIPNFWQERSTTFFQLSSQCKLLSSSYRVSFLVVNGATTRIRDDDDAPVVGGGAGPLQQQSLEPALGLSWNQCVNCSFLVVKGSATTNYSQQGTTNNPNNNKTQPVSVIRRVLKCRKSPRLPPEATLDFYVDYGGTFRIK
jgi:RecA/RadA recombinase